ncbi:MAG: hypothetical protein K0S38_235 [Candidatus Paceibacter sp.]|jgi:hypothetical protein|nr:hypothetical protein [Candidatus Paceibacter sp.]
MKHFYQNIPGWFLAEDVYSEAVRRASDGAHFVEVGSWKGKSTSFMAVEIANSGKKITFDCIDNWVGSKNKDELQYDDLDVQKGGLFEVFKKNIESVAAYVNPIRMDSTAAAMLYKDGSLDFIYIDAAHDYESVKKDIAAWLPKLKPDGMITGDDFVANWPGVVRAVQETFGHELVVAHPTWVIDRTKIKRQTTYDIIVRTHSGDNVHDGKRIVDVSKTDIIYRCLKSLVASLNAYEGKARIIVFDDHSSDECVDGIKRILSHSKHQSKFFHVIETGNTASLKACYEYARDYGADVIYFVEDDYLHTPSAISEMIESYEMFKQNLGGREVAIFPVDYPDRYKSNSLYDSRIVLGKYRHWRTTEHSTVTCMISRCAIFRHWIRFELMWKSHAQFINEDETINRLWKNDIVLFSPIPSLAFHMQFSEQMPPFVDWKHVWDEMAYD